MSRREELAARGPALVVIAIASLLAVGCGAALTAGGIGIVAATKKSGGGAGATPNAPPSVPTASVTGDTSGGSVNLDFTITDPEGDSAALTFRWSNDANEA